MSFHFMIVSHLLLILHKCLKPEMWQKVAKFKGAEYFRKALYFCTCWIQRLHRVLCCCSGIDSHFSHQSTFISRRQNASPSWVVWWLHGSMVFILVYYCLYRWTWYLQAFGNCTQGWTRLVEVYYFSSEVLADFFLIFPWSQAKRHWVWR